MSLFAVAALIVAGTTVVPWLQGPASLAAAGYGWDDRPCRLEKPWTLDADFDLQAALNFEDFRDAETISVRLLVVTDSGLSAQSVTSNPLPDDVDWEADSYYLPAQLWVPRP